MSTPHTGALASGLLQKSHDHPAKPDPQSKIEHEQDDQPKSPSAGYPFGREEAGMWLWGCRSSFRLGQIGRVAVVGRARIAPFCQ